MLNKLIVAAAGSGKTTFLVNEALKQDDNVLITTFTEANELEIRNKILEIRKTIPSNITIQTWFSLLLKHGAKPYQDGVFDEKIKGLVLVNRLSAPFVLEKETKEHYFTSDNKIYSDKLSKFVIKCNAFSEGEVMSRLARIYPNIFIDEIQDLAGCDLDILKLLFKTPSSILMTGDPRQATYLTHYEKRYKKYNGGLIQNFISIECENGICEIDVSSLSHSYRNNEEICKFSSALYPCFEECKSKQKLKTDHDGVFLIRQSDVKDYLEKYDPQILRYSGSEPPEINFGLSKGRGFDRVLIHPTGKIKEYLRDGDISKIETIIPKFYVAITRAKFSVGIVFDYRDDVEYVGGIKKYNQKQIKTLWDFF